MDGGPLRRWWPVVAVIALLAVAALATPRSALRPTPVQPAGGEEFRLPEFTPEAVWPTPIPPDEPGRPSANPAGLPGWLATAATVLLIAAVLAVIALLVVVLVRASGRRTARPRPTAAVGPPEPTPEAAVAAVDAGLLELADLDGDPRRAVIGCWVRLEQAATAAGTERRPGDTSTDLVGRLLSQHQVSGDVLAGLARLYRDARYGRHEVDEHMRDNARAALHRLRGELTAGAAR